MSSRKKSGGGSSASPSADGEGATVRRSNSNKKSSGEGVRKRVVSDVAVGEQAAPVLSASPSEPIVALSPSPSASPATAMVSPLSSSSPPAYFPSTRPTSPWDSIACVALLSVPAALIVFHVRDPLTKLQIACNALLSVAAYLAVYKLIPVIQRYTMKRNMSGKDLNKPGRREDKPDIPESQGVVSGVVFVIVIIFLQLQYATENRLALVEYNAALHSIGFMIFLGFADDVVDLPWRYKLILPTLATLPLLVAYSGSTYIAVPWPLVELLGSSINLGILYQVYMGLLAVFCTNAINIFAGLNGLEAGQSLVIGVSILVHNVLELPGTHHANHLFSIFLIIPFIAVTLGLLKWNWFPSHVFVGDCYCYFAGMTFAVVGILGHFSKTLLLFFLPQILNFLYSLPQILGLFGLVCPRHRLPRYNAATDKLEAVPSHHNLINLVLMITGPQHERTLCRILLVLQVVCSVLAFVIRYYVAGYFFDGAAAGGAKA